ncbi:MAG: 16S rRNA processing protein RimM [Myxococcaceae bacterium]|nr:16S rRNA processing protein RimM [Myxococcaceae bacterium]MBH2006602.1 16S rRNA processing protein RimM [Myxococcaceae bacterium]
MNPLPPDWVCLGKVGRAHGIEGALICRLFHPDGEVLRPGIELALVQREVRYLSIEQILPGARVRLRSIDTRTQAEQLVNSEIWVRRTDFPDLAQDEIYLADLVGFSALNLEGKILGVVSGFSDNRAQTLVELNGSFLVPFVKPILCSVDEKTRTIFLDYSDEV